MKSSIPTIIISFSLGFACNEFLINSDAETVIYTDSTTYPDNKSQSKLLQQTQKIDHQALVTNDEVATDLNVEPNNIQNQTTPTSELTVQGIIDLAVEEGLSEEDYHLLQDRIPNLSIEEQTALHEEIISKLPNEKLIGLLRLVTKNIIKNDPSLLVELIRHSQPEGGDIVAKAGFTIFAKQSLEDAWSLANSLGPGSEDNLLSSNSLRSSRFSMLVELSKGAGNLNELLDFVSTLKGRDKLTYLEPIVHISAKEDLHGTRVQIMALPAGESKTRAMSRIMRIWSDENADEAMEWLIDNPDVTDKFAVIRTAQQLLKQSGSATFSNHYQNSNSDAIKLQLASAAAQHYVTSDLDQSIDWLKTMDNPREQSSAIYSTLRELGYEQNMEDHIQILDSVYSSDNAKQIKYRYSSSLTEWYKYEPEKVRAYVQNLPTEQADLRKYLTTKLKL